MHIVSCFKVVPEEQDIVVTPDQNLVLIVRISKSASSI